MDEGSFNCVRVEQVRIALLLDQRNLPGSAIGARTPNGASLADRHIALATWAVRDGRATVAVARATRALVWVRTVNEMGLDCHTVAGRGANHARYRDDRETRYRSQGSWSEVCPTSCIDHRDYEGLSDTTYEVVTN